LEQPFSGTFGELLQATKKLQNILGIKSTNTTLLNMDGAYQDSLRDSTFTRKMDATSNCAKTLNMSPSKERFYKRITMGKKPMKIIISNGHPNQ
jgi:hypothetical protein